METISFEKETEGNLAEAFFLRVQEDLKNEKRKLEQMDENKDVSRQEYLEIKAQAKLVAFLSEMKTAATLCSEAKENGNIELFDAMKAYLKL